MRRSLSFPARIASLAALGGGALLLVADSAECRDGFEETRYSASFRSTCPSDLAVGAGVLRVVLNEQRDQQLLDALREAGLRAKDVHTRHQEVRADICANTGFSFSLSSGQTELRCEEVRFAADVQEITCSHDRAASPRVLDVGVRPRDHDEDASFPDADDADADADVASDAGADDDASVTGPEPALTPERPSSCTITFTKMAN
jgi:hypothetical protein